ncbi:phosphoenolpyruvate--protein phosphotransferase [Parvibaculum sp.]|uniref:phosphoenolpyruvate--protein phosphotransferase n=1 Tax=Parvibaculum sp. TaxID=2024848 RepID=UPI0027283381|nr:phosphoenolpyruvate--protein phosphotransferase [Parvibaculum sp.]MDO9127140.1 phosphoenolpyruvate--protein phosphotransferase [Parvibaculum sp.]MDP1625610.1 phosphoenolpyruvate--protein phosphotransferase [Parvibaculum sp.]MDP2148973.1 phosphoenolpyruvate--protein phosphotransferase [Parvibaculum sp.]MDP3328591.1 phosphoenolpyruvate--protein phosphotransferase [Parvibaculum sp.]
MPGSVGGPRILLRRLREVMAEPESAQKRLDKIVVLIASNMVAEVCSAYLMNGARELELSATEGLKPTAVHATRLKVGEGLVGDIAAHARPLNLADAQSHPGFAYRPETGEEIYKSLMGVPILRSGKVVGVLVVQNRTKRHYTEEEVEALQTVAMVLAEVVAAADLVTEQQEERLLGRPTSVHIVGASFSEGIALGHAVLHEPRVHVTKLIAEDTELELKRLEQAVYALRGSIDDMLETEDLSHAGEHREVLQAYRMFANDRGWLQRMLEAVKTGLTAEAAVERVQNDTRARLQRAADPYIRDRLHDFDDLANRLLRQLTGVTLASLSANLPSDAIIIARNMGPAELLDYDKSRLRGLVLEDGAPNAHVSIVARAFGIATVGRAEDILENIEPGDAIIVDGDTGEIYIRPSQEVIASYSEKARFRARKQEQYKEIRGEPSVTLDGHDVALYVNAGLQVDLPHLEEAGAHGIGLFRTELQFMIASTLPSLREQIELYRAVLDAAGDKPAVFRTLDIGGDKMLPYMNLAALKEENPALGWRAIRISLDRPALLRHQVRALLTAAAGRSLRIMFPMVAEVAEYSRARALVDKELARLDKFGKERPASLEIGTMLEVPSLAWQLDALLPLVDFVSIGSNDLLQFLFASDRGNPRVATRYDFLSPAVLSFLRHIVVKCDEHKTPLTLCGEMSGRPLEAMALVGLGLRRVSMSPAAVGPVKMMVRSLDVGRLEAFMAGLYGLPDRSVRAHLAAFAEEHGVAV